MKILSFDIGIRNLSYCIIDDNFKIYDWGIIDLCGKFDIKKDKIKIFENIPNILDSKCLCELNIDVVLIENQPAMKNPKMKMIETIIYSYFIIKGLNNESSKISKVLLVNAKNKLSFYDGDKIICKSKSKYSQNKYLGIEYTKYYLKKNNSIDKLEYFNNFKKKDDLADSYLQALSYVKSENEKVIINDEIDSIDELIEL